MGNIMCFTTSLEALDAQHSVFCFCFFCILAVWNNVCRCCLLLILTMYGIFQNCQTAAESKWAAMFMHLSSHHCNKLYHYVIFSGMVEVQTALLKNDCVTSNRLGDKVAQWSSHIKTFSGLRLSRSLQL